MFNLLGEKEKTQLLHNRPIDFYYPEEIIIEMVYENKHQGSDYISV